MAIPTAASILVVVVVVKAKTQHKRAESNDANLERLQQARVTKHAKRRARVATEAAEIDVDDDG